MSQLQELHKKVKEKQASIRLKITQLLKSVKERAWSFQTEIILAQWKVIHLLKRLTKTHSTIVYRNVRTTQNVMESQTNIPFFCPVDLGQGAFNGIIQGQETCTWINQFIYLLKLVIHALDPRVWESASAIHIAGRSSYFNLPSMRQLKTRYNYTDVSLCTWVRQHSAEVQTPI